MALGVRGNLKLTTVALAPQMFICFITPPERLHDSCCNQYISLNCVCSNKIIVERPEMGGSKMQPEYYDY